LSAPDHRAGRAQKYGRVIDDEDANILLRVGIASYWRSSSGHLGSWQSLLITANDHLRFIGSRW
jgi:hypothetical protein